MIKSTEYLRKRFKNLDIGVSIHLETFAPIVYVKYPNGHEMQYQLNMTDIEDKDNVFRPIEIEISQYLNKLREEKINRILK